MNTGTEIRVVKPSWYRRIFNWLTRHETPPGIGPETHRKALWSAFVFCTALAAIGVAGDLTMYLNYRLSLTLWEGQASMFSMSSLKLLSYLSQLAPEGMLSLFAYAFIVYAVVVRLNRKAIPLSVLDVAVTTILATLMFEPIRILPPYYGFGSVLIPALVALALYYRGHLNSGATRLIMFILATITIVDESMGSAVFRLVILEHGEGAFLVNMDYIGDASRVIDLLQFPFVIMLPIALLATARTPATSQAVIPQRRWWSVSDLLVALALLLSTVHAINMSWLIPANNFWLYYLAGGFTSRHAGTDFVLLALVIAAYSSRIVSQRFKVFLISGLCLYLLREVPVFFLREFSIDTTALGLIVFGLGALWLSTQGKPVKALLPASIVIVLNSFAIDAWLNLEKPVKKIAGLYGDVAPFLVALKIGAYELVLLALVPAMLLLAWWFIEPDDVAAMFKR